ncbi:MAG: 4-(cytidine 5'-diphospho)-2-C-methyl-D-erythritol kinase [Elusimicrobia bacterium RIFOXYA2_FULL_50_26]|nr:MAG: 4-(cytidine 5'-diphospho)-2-C-methyl-D-erythritol kinase [Elusimicrobia bacterium RIFOXYA2_FULL_50_26]OGS22334.1 MAG: 4-(cytidine 5'-diphospho)-2-C-methyl-D-erythritol kinase [Elusimicrobia bacterium RIFOXYB2_FULL_50_12]
MKFLAPAKINIYLEITGRRPDGYHTLETIFQTVSLYDTLAFEPKKSALTLTCDDKDLPCDETNLALRAAVLLRDKNGVKAGAEIHLQKRIPMGAGLGGGSSDAAAVLKGLRKLWGLDVTDTALSELAVQLGADVPFFLKGGTVLGTGIGECLELVKNVLPASYLLVYPGFGVPTADVYRKLKLPLTRKRKITKIKNLLETGSVPDVWSRYMFNRLEEVVLPEFRMVRHARDVLKSFGCPTLMSGSGSTVFAVVPSLQRGEEIKSQLKKYPWKIYPVQTVRSR